MCKKGLCVFNWIYYYSAGRNSAIKGRSANHPAMHSSVSSGLAASSASGSASGSLGSTLESLARELHSIL